MNIDTQMIAIISFIVAITALRIYSDIVEIIAVRRVQHSAVTATAKNKTPRITVLVQVNSGIEAFIPLLDHLYGQHYVNLEVVVLLGQKASKDANKILTAYRREHHIKLLKIAKQTKNTTLETTIRQKATGELIMPLSKDDRLSENFFNMIAVDSLEREEDILMPRQHLAAGKTLLSAQYVVQHMWRYIWTRFDKACVVKGVQDGYVYRREALLRRPSIATTMHCTLSYRTAVIVSPDATRSFARSANNLLLTNADIAPGIIIGAITLFVIAFVEEYSKLPLIELLPVGYVILFILFMWDVKEYTALERVTHILFVPFSLVMFAALYLTAIWMRLWTFLKNAPVTVRRMIIAARKIATPRRQ